MHQSITCVALYDTLGADAMKYILNQTELETIIVSNDFIVKLAISKLEDSQTMNPRMFRLKNIIAMENTVSDDERRICKFADIEVYTYDQLIEEGKELSKTGKVSLHEPTPDDCFMVMYTSGTTGDPKGVKMTHR